MRDDTLYVTAEPPHDKHLWAVSIVRIRKNSTGEVVQFLNQEICDDDGSMNVYIWEAGSFRCDCNRSLFFARTKGEELDEDIKCTHDNYSVEVINPRSKQILYSEFLHFDDSLPYVEGLEQLPGEEPLNYDYSNIPMV